ncbi:hypothetical protein GCM10011363_42320 [Marivita lacus]|uniref:Uncharacterized protein n=1 Tax=Marivita lacus TaxID=1323742 RepID=A0ABQ1LBW4_9RHOB|nr:hypothetical protein GCM10011363_42320 [Marivita lacus]
MAPACLSSQSLDVDEQCTDCDANQAGFPNAMLTDLQPRATCEHALIKCFASADDLKSSAQITNAIYPGIPGSVGCAA